MWGKVKTKIPLMGMNPIKKELIKKIVPQERLIYRVYNFVRSGLTESWNFVPFLTLKHDTEVVEKIREALR